MNRIIKFRIWDSVDKKFTYLQINPGECIGFNLYPARKFFQQFIGGKDCKGKEIYEGDFVKISEGRFGTQFCEIKYYCPEFTLSLISNKDEVSFPMDLSWRGSGKIEVIGNIFENEMETIYEK